MSKGPTDAAIEAALNAYMGALNLHLEHGAVRAAVDTVWPLAFDAGVAEGWRQAAEAIERPDSMLCDCPPRHENMPINPSTGAEMDHHCDCAAVRAAATMLRSYSATGHGQQCVHGTEMEVRRWLVAGPGVEPDGPPL